ncbi:MAG: formylglycine-generating enzyme family protein [Fibromonadales bacterium]|nr:formylglycine-generating enzyme family protein [Fibromonadales bacterium]
MQKGLVFTFAVMLFSAWCFAQAQDSSFGVLSIQSSTPAGVWLNEQAVGNTPFSMKVPDGWTIYSVRAPGYWTEIYLSNIEKLGVVSQNAQLKKYGLPKDQTPDISDINDLRILENMYDSLSKHKAVAIPDSTCLAIFAAEFPLPIAAPSPLTDTSEIYRNYYKVYIAERQNSFYEWYANCSGPTEMQLSTISKRIDELGTKKLNGFVPVTSAKFESTSANDLNGNLEIFFRSPDGRADVAWKGTWENDFISGNALIQALTAEVTSALAFITVQNKTLWIPADSGYSRHFFKYHELYISWNGWIIPMKGTFTLPEWLAKFAPVDSIPSISAPEELAIAKAVLVKVPNGKFKYRGQEKQMRTFAINAFTINQSLYKDKCGEKKNFDQVKGDSLPAHSVTWKEANNCCIALGGELPTEAEWEYAARAGSPLTYSWPNNANPKDYAVFNSKKPIISGSKKPNGWGIFDMFGNVAEWVKDDGFWFGKYKYLKGGSWKSSAKDLSIENREEEDMRYWGTHTGFRCVFRP